MTSECLYQLLSLSLSELYICWFVTRHETVISRSSPGRSLSICHTYRELFGEYFSLFSTTTICPCEMIKQWPWKANVNGIFPSWIYHSDYLLLFFTSPSYLWLYAASTRFSLQISVLFTKIKLVTLFITCTQIKIEKDIYRSPPSTTPHLTGDRLANATDFECFQTYKTNSTSWHYSWKNMEIWSIVTHMKTHYPTAKQQICIYLSLAMQNNVFCVWLFRGLKGEQIHEAKMLMLVWFTLHKQNNRASLSYWVFWKIIKSHFPVAIL